MKKHNLYWLGGIAAAVLAVLLLAGIVLVKHEPNFYRQGHVPPSAERKVQANKFLNNFLQMMANIKGRQEKWGCNATETELNCFFQDAFDQLGEAESLRKLGITSPTVTLEGEQVRMAFRYGKGWFSTVISYDLKVWLVSKEPNVIAVQIMTARAGAMPISCQSILHQLSDFATKQNFKVMLYRHEGTPVAIVSLQPDQPNPVSTLTMLTFNASSLIIRGMTSEHALPPLPLPNIKAPSSIAQ